MPLLLETVGPRTGAAPVTYELTEQGTVDLLSVFASFDGTSASIPWVPAVTIRAQNGTILARVSPDSTLAIGDTADVTYAPFLRGEQSAAPVASGGGWNALPESLALKTWTLDPTNADAAINLGGSTIISGVWLDAGVTITTLAMPSIAHSATPIVHAYAAIYNASFALVAISFDTPAYGFTIGWNLATLTTPYVTPVAGVYYLGSCWDPVGSAPTTIAGQGNGTIGGLVMPGGKYRVRSVAAVPAFPATFTGTQLTAQTPLMLAY